MKFFLACSLVDLPLCIHFAGWTTKIHQLPHLRFPSFLVFQALSQSVYPFFFKKVFAFSKVISPLALSGFLSFRSSVGRKVNRSLSFLQSQKCYPQQSCWCQEPHLFHLASPLKPWCPISTLLFYHFCMESKIEFVSLGVAFPGTQVSP